MIETILDLLARSVRAAQQIADAQLEADLQSAIARMRASAPDVGAEYAAALAARGIERAEPAAMSPTRRAYWDSDELPPLRSDLGGLAARESHRDTVPAAPDTLPGGTEPSSIYDEPEGEG